MKTGLKKSQKTTEIFFDESSPWITVNTYNTDLKNRLTVSYNIVTVEGTAASRVFFHLKAEAVRM